MDLLFPFAIEVLNVYDRGLVYDLWGFEACELSSGLID